MNALSNAIVQDDRRSGPASSALPEATGSQTGVSVGYAPSTLSEEHTIDGYAEANWDACEAFRLQCYKWMLFLDPEDDGSIQTDRQNRAFAAQCVQAVYAWLDAKYANHLELQPEAEAVALLTIYCGINYSGYAQHCLSDVEEWAYDLLDRLPASRLKTRLMCQMVISNEDPDLADAINADIATWDTTQLTDEDKYLKELLNPALA